LHIWKAYRIFIYHPIFIHFNFSEFIELKDSGRVSLDFLYLMVFEINSTERGTHVPNSKIWTLFFYIQFYLLFFIIVSSKIICIHLLLIYKCWTFPWRHATILSCPLFSFQLEILMPIFRFKNSNLFVHFANTWKSKVLTSNVADHVFEPWSGQTKDYKICICCFSA
jgi:hypothetical protein